MTGTAKFIKSKFKSTTITISFIMALVSPFALFSSFNINSFSTEVITEEVANEEAIIEETPTFQDYLNISYQNLGLEDLGLSFDIFEKAMRGFFTLKNEGKLDKDILSIADFQQSSRNKRLYVIDVKNNKLMYNTYVSHGRNSGDEFATRFSNKHSSYMSSLGFYVTGERYTGKHGLSLRLDGQERGFNCNARARAVVIHGADYVSAGIARNGRLGRSLGCPALSWDVSAPIMNYIADKSALFIYANQANYLQASRFVRASDENFAFNTAIVSPSEIASTSVRQEQGQ